MRGWHGTSSPTNRYSAAFQISSIVTTRRSLDFPRRRSIFWLELSWSLNSGAGEAIFESRADRLAPATQIFQQQIGAVRAAVSHLARQRPQRNGIGRESPRRLIAFETQPVFKTRNKFVAVFQIARLLDSDKPQVFEF